MGITSETLKTKCRHGWITRDWTYRRIGVLVCTDSTEGTTGDEYQLVAEVDLADPDIMADLVMAQIENNGENSLTFKIVSTLPEGTKEIPVVNDTEVASGGVHVDVRKVLEDVPPGPALYRIYVKSTNTGAPTNYKVILRTIKEFK